MNLTDLTTELQARAGDPGTGLPAVSRLSAVRHRIRVRRRRQVASVAGIAVIGVAAVVLAPSLSGIRADRTSTPASPAAPSHRLTFAADVAGDPLVASGVGTPGQQDLVVRFTPTATNLSVSTYCRVSEAKGSTTSTTLTVNGKPMTRSECRPEAEPNQQTVSWGDDPRASRTVWELEGLKVGHEMEFRLRVTDPQPGFDPAGTVRLGVGIYWSRSPRREVAGVWAPVYSDGAGHGYILWKVFSIDLGPGPVDNQRLSLGVSAGRYPVRVLWGVTGSEQGKKPTGEARLLIDGKPGPTDPVMGVVAIDEMLDAGAHTFSFQATPQSRGTMQLGYYLRQ